MKLGILHTGIRGDEKLLIQAAQDRNVDYDLIDVRTLKLDSKNHDGWYKYDVLLERCISSIRGNATIEYLTNIGVNVVNDSSVMSICNDKFQTVTILEKAGVQTVKSILVFDENSAKNAVRELGNYPVVLKSRSGSWGRLMAKVNDFESLEAIFEHRKYMGPEHSAVIVQEYIEKNEGRDIRAFVIDGETVAAIYRASEHWITNTARGAIATKCPITDELADICKESSDAVGGGLLALDVFESEKGMQINEINHTMEFKNSEKPTGVDISGKVIDYCISVARK